MRRVLTFLGTWALLMCVVALCIAGAKFAYGQWPSCGPRFTINEQYYRGETVFWLRRRGNGFWPVCGRYALDSPSMFSTVESARAAAQSRRREDSEERVVGTVD